MTVYVHNAPPSLVAMYETKAIAKGRDLLFRLLSAHRMREAWKELGKYVRNEDEYATIFGEIVFLLHRARRETGVRRSDERARFEKIALMAQELSVLVANGPLDTLVFHLFPDDVMCANGVPGWEAMSQADRRAHALRTQRLWPAFPEILEAASRAARTLGAEAMTRARTVERDLGPAEHRRLFLVRGLCRYFNQTYGHELRGTVANVASSILKEELTAADVSKAIRGSH